MLSGALLLAGGCGEADTRPGPGTTSTPSSTAGSGGSSSTSTGGGGSGGMATGGMATGGAATGGGGATGGTGGQSLCGNGMLDPGESCEGDNLQGETCASLGFPGGSLACSAACAFDLAECTGSDGCYDGVDNDGDGKSDCQEADCASICASACYAPMVLADPDSTSGSTAGHANTLTSSCVAQSGPEVVYPLTAAQTGVLDVTLSETSGGPFSISVRSACDADGSEIACSNDYVAGTADQKAVSIPVVGGQTVFILVDGDGADSEGGFLLVANSRPIVCGDGLQDAPEGCDDTNTSNGDGCSSTCTVESTETEVNDTRAQADPFTSPWYASIEPAGDVDYVQIDWPSPAGMAVSTAGVGPGRCADGTMDTVVTIYDGAGAALATNDDRAGTCSLATVTSLPAGTYYARIEAPPGANASAATFPYSLSVTAFVCGNGALQTGEDCDDGNTAPGDGCDASCKVEVDETEPNGTLAQADVYASPWIARVDPDGDVDVVSVTVPGPGSKITAVTTDPTGGAGCLGSIDTYVEIATSGDIVLASNDDANGAYCSVAVAGNLPAGTYYVRVKAPPALDAANVYIFTYKLGVTVE